MNTFQAVTLVAICLFVLREIRRWRSCAAATAPARWPVYVLLLAAFAILFPNRVTGLAQSLGIHRGADLVLYLFALGSIAAFGYFYNKCCLLQDQVVALTRELAIRDAVEPGQVIYFRDEKEQAA